MKDYEDKTLEYIQRGYINNSRNLYLWTLLYISGLSAEALTNETITKILRFMHSVNAVYAGRWHE